MMAARCDNYTTTSRAEDCASTTCSDNLRSTARSDDPAETVRKLRVLLERRRRWQAHRAGWQRRFIPTGLTRLDAVLPSGGLPCGAVTEILSEGVGFGAFTLALRIARQALQSPEQGAAKSVPAAPAQLVIVDTNADLYPPAIHAFGIAFDQLIVLRVPERGRARGEALWAVDQVLRCRAVAAVIAPISQLDERQARRLQLAA